MDKEAVSFYAHVVENGGSYLLVEGIEENDINHRGEFEVTLKDSKSTVLDIDGNKIELSDIGTDRSVRITYEGAVLETYPAQINGVTLIEIIE